MADKLAVLAGGRRSWSRGPRWSGSSASPGVGEALPVFDDRERAMSALTSERRG
jgi:hypothetical protein